MAKLTLTQAQRVLLGIVTSVESGVTTPEEAVNELALLKKEAKEAGLNFTANYTLADFEKIQADASVYDLSTSTFDESVEPSY